jgi:hypothetical protein
VRYRPKRKVKRILLVLPVEGKAIGSWNKMSMCHCLRIRLVQGGEILCLGWTPLHQARKNLIDRFPKRNSSCEHCLRHSRMSSCLLEESLFLMIGQNAGMPTPGNEISIAEKPLLGMVSGVPASGIGKVQTPPPTSQLKCLHMFSAALHHPSSSFGTYNGQDVFDLLEIRGYHINDQYAT